MPVRAEPESTGNDDLSQILDVLPSRYALLVYLARHPEGAQVAELSRQLSLNSSTVRHQLQNLVKIGVVTTDADPYFPMQGQRPTYSLDRARFLKALRGLAHELQAVVVDDAQQLPLDQRLTLTLDDLRSLLDRN